MLIERGARRTCLSELYTGVVGLTALLMAACAGGRGSFELSSWETSQHQWSIAAYHSQEAARLRQKADDLYAQARVYSRLFGAQSEWTTGARLLAQSYQDAADEQARLAEEHLTIAERTGFPRANPSLATTSKERP